MIEIHGAQLSLNGEVHTHDRGEKHWRHEVCPLSDSEQEPDSLPLYPLRVTSVTSKEVQNVTSSEDQVRKSVGPVPVLM